MKTVLLLFALFLSCVAHAGETNTVEVLGKLADDRVTVKQVEKFAFMPNQHVPIDKKVTAFGKERNYTSYTFLAASRINSLNGSKGGVQGGAIG